MKLVKADKFYNRKEVEDDKTTMYIFTDNTNRDSGANLIPDDSWYATKYGTGKHYPQVTSALIRGLDNAYPITTQHWYNKEKKGIFGRWNDEDFDEFKKVIDDDFNEIIKNLKKYNRIIFPFGGFFNTKISNISESRVPQLHKYLFDKIQELKLEIDMNNADR